MNQLLDWCEKWGCLLSCLLILVLLLFLSIGLCSLGFPSGCNKDCNSQPVEFLYIPIPGTNYSTFYNVSSSGKPLRSQPEEEPIVEPHTTSGFHESPPPEEEPIVEPHVSVAEP